MFVYDKTNAGQASTIAKVTVEGIVRFLWYGVVLLSPMPFVLVGDPTVVLKGGDNGSWVRRQTSRFSAIDTKALF